MKVKLFCALDVEDIEKDINRFLCENIKVHAIKMISRTNTVVVLISYTEL